jgi:hypothetical protein
MSLPPSDAERIGIAFAAGLAFWLLCSFLAGRLRARRRREREAEPPREALLALHYGENAHRSSRNRPVGGLPFIAMSLAVVLQRGTEPWQYWLWGGFALLNLPGAWNDLHDYARSITLRPVIAAHDEGLYLSNWRRTSFLPWAEIDLVYTDPPESGGYVAAEQKIVLHVESKRGRKWRFSSRDFAADAPAEFAGLVALAAIRTAPADSMLIRGRL